MHIFIVGSIQVLCACCNRSYDGVSAPVDLFRYVGSDYMIGLSLFHTISPSSGINCTGKRSSGYDIGVFFLFDDFLYP